MKQKIGLSDFQYDKKSILGQGGNAIVYRATKKPGNEVALKILTKVNGNIPKIKIKRFLAETKIVLKEQKNIVGILPILDYALPDEEGNYWYTMPIAIPLEQKILSYSIEDKTQCIIELAMTMSKLHEKGIVHRDIKPSNLYYYNDNYCFGDFGLVDYPEKEDITTPKDAVGAKFTIAPEMKRYAHTADGKKADVYSLAKTLWMILSNNHKGFEGIYDPGTSIVGLRYLTQFKNEHLVELEELLIDATREAFDLRPNMQDFAQNLNIWLNVKADWKKSCRSQWQYIQKILFNSIAPATAYWTDRESIVKVLNLLGRMPSLNHMFYPTGGGSDLVNAELASETGCVSVNADPQDTSIIKPAQLIIENFGTDIIWSYFRLELGELSAVVDHPTDQIYELVTEDVPGHYISWKCGNYGYYENDKPLPAGYRVVRRYFSGTFVFFMKPSAYNHIHGVYDARHNKMGNTEFRHYIEKLKAIHDEFRKRIIDEEKAFNAFTNYINEQDRQLLLKERHSIDEDTLKQIHRDSLFKKWVIDNYEMLDFACIVSEDKLIKESKFAYFIKFEISLRTIDLINMCDSLKKDNYLYVCCNGKIISMSGINKANLNRMVFYSTASALAAKKMCYQVILDQYGHAEEVSDQTSAYDFFSILFERIAPPTHLFTKEELENVMRAGDDSKNNVLVIDENGFARLVPADENTSLYPVRYETWVAYNNYVGKYSSLNTVGQVYLASLNGWLEHLQTGADVCVDFVSSNNTDALISKIKHYY